MGGGRSRRSFRSSRSLQSLGSLRSNASKSIFSAFSARTSATTNSALRHNGHVRSQRVQREAQIETEQLSKLASLPEERKKKKKKHHHKHKKQREETVMEYGDVIECTKRRKRRKNKHRYKKKGKKQMTHNKRDQTVPSAVVATSKRATKAMQRLAAIDEDKRLLAQIFPPIPSLSERKTKKIAREAAVAAPSVMPSKEVEKSPTSSSHEKNHSKKGLRHFWRTHHLGRKELPPIV